MPQQHITQEMFAETIRDVLAEARSVPTQEANNERMQAFFNTWKGIGAVLSVLVILVGASMYVLSLQFVDEKDFETVKLEQKSVDDSLVLEQLELKNKIVEVKAEAEAKTQLVSQELTSKIEAVETEEEHIKDDVEDIKDNVEEIKKDQKIQNENMTRLLIKLNVKPVEVPK